MDSNYGYFFERAVGVKLNNQTTAYKVIILFVAGNVYWTGVSLCIAILANFLRFLLFFVCAYCVCIVNR